MISQHDALLRAICEFPDEDLPRLALADLIEEEGDPTRAAFIRTQVELAGVPEYDPVWVKCRQFGIGTIRGWAMAHTLPRSLPDGFSWHAYRFRRGLPWLALALSTEAFARRSAALLATAPIQALSFDDRARPDLAELAGCPDLTRLRRLDFSHARLDADDIAALAHSPYAVNLTELRFEHGSITAEGVQALARSPLFARLEGLKFGQNRIAPDLLIDALAAAGEPGNLRRLSVPFCELHRGDALTLFDLPVMEGLDELDLGQNRRFGPGGAEALAESGALRGLRTLNLSETLLGTEGVRSLLSASGLSGVRSLDLSANKLGPVAVGLMAGSPAVRGLRVLNLSNNRITNGGAETLANARHLQGLLELDLSDAEVGDAGALALAASEHLEGLLRLVVRDRNRPLGDEARAALVERFGERVTAE